jgi:uncharacterized membrane protein YedE/YeeE
MKGTFGRIFRRGAENERHGASIRAIWLFAHHWHCGWIMGRLLGATLLGAFSVSLLSYQLVRGHSSCLSEGSCLETPLLSSNWSIPADRKVVDKELIIGSALFGVGFGLSGMRPGPAMFWAALGDYNMIFYHWPAFVIGAKAAQLYKDRKEKLE